MTWFRHHVLRRRALAVLLVGLALLMRIAVPAGYMPAFAGGAITVVLCSGDAPQKMTMAMPGGAGHRDGEHGRELPCGFSALSVASLAGADPVVIPAAIAFIVATTIAASRARVAARTPYLRPPLRGPPTTA